MKSIFLKSLLIGAMAFTVSPVYSQADSDVVVQSDSLTNLLNILNNAPDDISSEELQRELVAAIEQFCQDMGPIDLDSPIANGSCSAEQLDILINAVVASLGADNALISDFLAALVTAGSDSDAVTIAAITAGIDATVASEATAAGPTDDTPTAAPPVVVLPTTTVPQGTGGTGGDAGISEVGN
ncbi:signal peptide protein [Pseudoalteromonas distincta]|uniref:Orphan protein n=1 Tax=Pseudoalteromonas distincta TaxID=77608 RepID=A0ABT9GB49_9GAMM|nr:MULTISPECIES: hypothetical protein [Pseudoalteromonas distincta group]KHM46542.1 signal peptide protein [Pseudoalteromonas elyakovii]KID34149.1 signal peptide protein [Pseudoalteromonas distincta]MDP4483091.1 hypothetical protein [Pseudoalteromonas elyakovii]